MNYPDQWTQAQVDEFYRWVSDHPAFSLHVSEEFPNLAAELEDKGLKPGDAEELAKYMKWLKLLPFTDIAIGRDLLVFYYTEFQRIGRLFRRTPKGKKLCSLFPVLARMVLQGSSTFPSNSAVLAADLMNCLKHYPNDAARFEILADLLVNTVGRFMHGFNADELPRAQLNRLIESEHVRRAERFDDLYKIKEKYEGYKMRVIENEEFQKDLGVLKRKFPKSFKLGKRVVRSEPVKKCSADRGQPSERDTVFQESFDFFCWKWFLDGMQGDEPIVTRLSFNVTPFGTSIFIPGYWSFDPKRDIRWKELKRFHESRGVVKRQGAAFEPNRRNRQTKEKLVLEAEKKSQALGERREEMIRRCIRMLGLVPNTDPAYIYRLLAEAKRKKQRRTP